jgi:hypothetical protein
MILANTYQDLKLLLDTLDGLPFENQKDIEFREAVRTVIEYYEENNNE